MNSNRILLPIAVVALASLGGCAAGVRYDDRYAYDDRYGYDNRYADDRYAYDEGYGYQAEVAAVPPAIEVEPELVVLPGLDVYAAPDVGDLYFADGWWWRPWNGHWYRSRHYGGGWALITGSPYFYTSIPHGWRDDYYHHRWHGRPYSYYHVSHNDVVSHWDRWKRDRYWRDDRWASSRDRYRRQNVSSDADRYRTRDEDRRVEYGRGTSAPTVRNERDRYARDRYDRDSYTRDRYEDRDYGTAGREIQRREVQREVSSPRVRSDSPTRFDERREPGRTLRQVDRGERDHGEARPVTRGRTEERRIEERRIEERRSAPTVRQTRPSTSTGTVRQTRPAVPAGTVHRAEPRRAEPTTRRNEPAFHSQPQPHRSAPMREPDRGRSSTTSKRVTTEKAKESPF